MKYHPIRAHLSAMLLIAMLLTITGCSHVAVIPITDDAPRTVGHAVTLTMDTSQRFQTIDGFGVNINGATWNDGKLKPALDLLTNTMGSTILRVILETSDWESTNDNDDPNTFNWDYYRPIYKNAHFQSLWNIIRYLEQNPNNTIVLNMMGWTPEWMGDKSIDPDKEDEWVEMIASVVYYARTTEHLKIALLSPTNELDTGYPEGPAIQPDQYARLLKKLLLRFQALDMGDIQLVAPDTANVQNAPGYVDKMLAEPIVRQHLAHLGFHNYSGDPGPAPDLNQDAGLDHGYWMTEFSQWCNGCDTGSQVSDQWKFATDTTDYLFDFLNQGASAGIIYDAFDSYYQHHRAFGYWGTLAYDQHSQTYTPRKRFYTVAQVFQFVRPGMVRIQISSDNDAVRVLAFIDPNSQAVTIVGHNTSANTITLNGSLGNRPDSASFSLYQTTQSANLEQGTPVSITNNSFSAHIAPDSIFTLTTLQSAYLPLITRSHLWFAPPS